jgi:hypothetical protein
MSTEFDKKTFQAEVNTPLITKIALNFFLNILAEVIRPAKLQNSDFQSHFFMSKIILIFIKKISLENINLGAQLFLKLFFDNFIFKNNLFLK